MPLCPGLEQIFLFLSVEQAHGFDCRRRRNAKTGVHGRLFIRRQPRCNPVLVAGKAPSSKWGDGVRDVRRESPSPSASVPPLWGNACQGRHSHFGLRRRSGIDIAVAQWQNTPLDPTPKGMGSHRLNRQPMDQIPGRFSPDNQSVETG